MPNVGARAGSHRHRARATGPQDDGLEASLLLGRPLGDDGLELSPLLPWALEALELSLLLPWALEDDRFEVRFMPQGAALEDDGLEARSFLLVVENDGLESQLLRWLEDHEAHGAGGLPVGAVVGGHCVVIAWEEMDGLDGLDGEC